MLYEETELHLLDQVRCSPRIFDPAHDFGASLELFWCCIAGRCLFEFGRRNLAVREGGLTGVYVSEGAGSHRPPPPPQYVGHDFPTPLLVQEKERR